MRDLLSGFMRKATKEKFLSEIRGGPLSCADKEIPQQQSDAAV